MINTTEIQLLTQALKTLEAGFGDLPDFRPEFDADSASAVLQTVAERMQDNYPYHHPQYAGQMLKPPHPIARMAYALSLWINPNNHALDGGRASSAMEKECILELGRMFGWDQPLGHLAGGGTMANLEALWVGGQLHPGKYIVASEQAHYTHSRISEVLKLPFSSVAADNDGRMDVGALDEKLASGDVGTVVVTVGTTGLGAVDPLPEILALKADYDFRIHVDAAYGGYFALSDLLADRTRASFERLGDADSIVIDPHKHGLQPYGCGCVLFRDAEVGRLYAHGSPYTYFTSDDLHLGEISLECSRPGAAAVALWATQQLLPLVPGGAFGESLDNCLLAARDFWTALTKSDRFTPLMLPELDIVVYAVNAEDSATAGRLASAVFDRAAGIGLHLALIELPTSLVRHYVSDMRETSETVTCLRSVLMKPEHREWLDRILALLEQSAADAV
ncbi:MAG: aminotransferase class I/II-fold pyridoxal phosphate-dependent enzyme [Gammaproteobacteria bacterium]|nr:aminotransferase class I/II-fold pyridoxal phosphate-dependent enzyme [Gammaproteobacteria bacterium]